MKKYLVGGAVRDYILKCPITERDWVIVGATPLDMLKKNYKQVGKDFPVFLHPESREEYSLARTERKCGIGYTGFICDVSPNITLEEDLRRRDLTINAIACDEQGNLIDPYHGQRDLQQRWLRHISISFTEDPLRVLRVARFAARFFHLHFRIAPETLSLMCNMNHELSSITPERIWKETEKALNTQNPHVYFQVLRNCGALKILFPEIDALFGIPTLEAWHPNIDSGIHTLMCVSRAAKLSTDISIYFATLCHDIGKTLTPKKFWPYHPKYNIMGINIIHMLCNRLKIPNSFRDLAVVVTKYHYLLHYVQYHTPITLIQFFNILDVWRKPERLEQFIIASQADVCGYMEYYHYSYPQGNFLRTAFSIVSSIHISHEIRFSGLKGKQIKQEINWKRCVALMNWLNNINIYQYKN